MSLVAPPIDYVRIRTALTAAASAGTGVPKGRIFLAEVGQTAAVRPPVPYLTFMLTSPSIRVGRDWATPVVDAAGVPTGLFRYEGPRTMMVGWDSYGASQEQAWGVMASLHAALGTPPLMELLQAAGLAHQASDSIADATALLNTQYEGRAHMDSEFGLMSSIQVDAGRMDQADVVGVVESDGSSATVTVTETRG